MEGDLIVRGKNLQKNYVIVRIITVIQSSVRSLM
jgi:hypothetical protein